MICFNLLVLHSMFLFWVFFISFYRWGTVTSNALMSFFLNADLWLSKSHIWISGLRLAVNQYMQVWHYSMQLSFILFLFFYNPHSQWLFIVFFIYIFFELTWSLWNTPPQTNTTTTTIFYSHTPQWCLQRKSCMAPCVFEWQRLTARMLNCSHNCEVHFRIRCLEHTCCSRWGKECTC